MIKSFLASSVIAFSIFPTAVRAVELSPREKSIYEYAYNYGYLVAMCSTYTTGDISANFFRNRANYIKKHDDVTPEMWETFLENFEKVSHKITRTKKCYRIMLDV